MKYIRRKIVRDVIDALKDASGNYYVQHANGLVETVEGAQFESQYEPLLRDRTKPAKVAKRKAKHAAAAEVVPS